MRAYFITVKTDTGEWVNLVYESSHRKGTGRHYDDLYVAARRKGLASTMKAVTPSDTGMFAHILNKQNMEDECFDDYRVIDLR